MSEKTQILNELKKNLKNVLGDKIQEVILYGSYIRDEETKDSDMDILIVTENILSWQEKNLIRDICSDISIDNEVIIDSKIISEEEISKKFWGKHPLISDALKLGIYAE